MSILKDSWKLNAPFSFIYMNGIFPLLVFVSLVQRFDFTYLLQSEKRNKCLTQHKTLCCMSQKMSKEMVNIAKGLLKMVKHISNTLECQRVMKDW